MSSRSKAEAERQQRDAHRERLQADKERRQRGQPLARRAPTRTTNPVLLIVCQGTVTEVEYFGHFRLATADIRAVGHAVDPENLVQVALALREASWQARFPYEQVWCVFDKDESSAQQVHAAMQRAAAMGIEVAFSNQAFEFWLLLHFLDHQGGGLGRRECADQVSTLLAAASPAGRYDGRRGKHVSRAMFEALEAYDPAQPAGRVPRRELAVRRAQSIEARWEAEGVEPARRESTTSVYRLVQVLQQYMA